MEICKLKNILITGCGSGLGNSLVKKSSKYPVKIFCHYKSKGPYNSLIGDINDRNFLNNLSEYLLKNNINVYINNAAIYLNKFFIECSDDEIEKLISTNLTSQILILKRVFNFFKQKQSGLIVNINSLAGLYPSAKESIYCASKFGLYGFSKSLQLESIDDKIEIIDVFPGAMKTKMTQDRDNYKSFMNPDDVAETIFNAIVNNQENLINEMIIRRKK